MSKCPSCNLDTTGKGWHDCPRCGQALRSVADILSPHVDSDDIARARGEVMTTKKEDLIRQQAYDAGFKDGLRAYAWWKDGVEVVGTTGMTLKEAVDRAQFTWNYDCGR